ncbi:MAG TPA: MBL fold metallo-hydrolase, partial [Anaerolineaceae bacterium]|nr:MBL fold metallo-hydrolase [Anaerolineaceae bacterium]
MGTIRELTLPAAQAAADTTAGSIFFIGTATVLMRIAGFTILTDPNFIHRHEQVDLGNGITATRQTDPAIDIAGLPPVDLILLSHFHGDHFDQVAAAKLDKSLPIVTTRAAGDDLKDRGFHNLFLLDTWDSITIRKGGPRLTITAAPGRHGPPVVSFALPEVMGSILDFEAPGGERLARLYITGDTLVIDDLKEIPDRFPGLDLALLHLGGTRVLGILVTMDGKQG